jgi:ubiquinol-cytochrome c reductase cytochrome c1 subunit
VNIKSLIIASLLLPVVALANSDGGVRLQKPSLQIDDTGSLQRGAKSFMTYCITCHSLKFMRYEQMAAGIGAVDGNGKADGVVMKDKMPATAKLTDSITSSLTADQATKTYGVAPPDLTLVVRQRGTAWLYTYLHDFYRDPARPLGSNNLLFPGVAMPNILEPLQGVQVPVYRQASIDIDGVLQQIQVIDHLKLDQPGAMTPAEFDRMTTDLVNFLNFASDPNQLARYRLGVEVLLFLALFLIIAYLLKKEYWKDVH